MGALLNCTKLIVKLFGPFAKSVHPGSCVSMCDSTRAESSVCAPEHVWCAGALVQDCSVPWCGLEQGSHVDTAARPICASHTVTITELLTLEASSSHIALKPLTMPHTPIPKLHSPVVPLLGY